MKNFKKIFGSILLIISFLLFISFVICLKANEIDFTLKLVVEIVLFVLFIFLFVLGILLNNSTDAAEKILEEKNNIVEYEDELFGKLIFQVDNNHIINYEGEPDNLELDNKQVSLWIRLHENVDISKIMCNLKKVCDNFDEIKEKIYPDFAEFLKNSNNFDKNGDMIEIDAEFLRKKLSFSSLVMNDNENIIEIWCCWENSGNQDYSIKYNVLEETFEFEML